MAILNVPPELKWFDKSKESDSVEFVLDFANRLPINLEQIFKNDRFIFFLNKIGKDYEVSADLFFSALTEATEILSRNLNEIRLTNEGSEVNRNNFRTGLANIGFTGDSLRLKIGTLNLLWKKVERTKRRQEFPFSIIDRIIFFSKRPLVRVMRKLFGCLNDILGSLKGVIPGLEAIKEWKDISENYLSIAEEG